MMAMRSVPFFTTVPTAVPTTAPRRSLHGPYSPYRNPTPVRMRIRVLCKRIRCHGFSEVECAVPHTSHTHTHPHTNIAMQHHLTRVRPERKSVPSILAMPHPRTPNLCNVGCQQCRTGDRFPGAKKSFPSCLRAVFPRRQHCKGGAGWPWPRNELGECRGDVFFARDGKGSHSEHAGIGIPAIFACALEAWPRYRSLCLCFFLFYFDIITVLFYRRSSVPFSLCFLIRIGVGRLLDRVDSLLL